MADQLLTLTAPDVPPPETSFAARGGFVWWYLDMLDHAGNGFVVIWSWGLPFLPGYTDAARRGKARSSRELPSLNVSVYREHRLVSYDLALHEAEDAEWTPHFDDEGVLLGESWRFGSSRIQSQRRADGDIELRLDLALRVPGTRAPFRASIRAIGALREPQPGENRAPAAHSWSPIAPGMRCVADFDIPGEPLLRVEGPAYHDRNDASVHIDGFGLEHWIWGRAHFGGERGVATRIWYLLWPENSDGPQAIGLEVSSHGETRQLALEVELGPGRRRFFGMRHWPRVVLRDERGELWLELSEQHVVDDGPFYLRTTGTARSAAGVESCFVGELVRPARVDLARHRPLVRMRVRQARSRSSFWLPLFCGPGSSSWRRLVTSIFTRAVHRLPDPATALPETWTLPRALPESSALPGSDAPLSTESEESDP